MMAKMLVIPTTGNIEVSKMTEVMSIYHMIT